MPIARSPIPTAQCPQCPSPNAQVEVPWFDRVMADIGDEQSIAQSLSTFSAHVARMKAIMEAATPDSYATEGSNPGLADPRQVFYSYF